MPVTWLISKPSHFTLNTFPHFKQINVLNLKQYFAGKTVAFFQPALEITVQIFFWGFINLSPRRQ
jgi:hypothetical protein